MKQLLKLFFVILVILSLPLAFNVRAGTENVEHTSKMAINDIRVGGACIVYFQDEAINYHPYNQEIGVHFSFVGKMPLADLRIKNGRLTKAITTNGEDILPEKQFYRSLRLLKLADNGITLKFEANLNLPQKKETNLSEISGVVSCYKTENTKKVDLGIIEIKKGAVNKSENISIDQINHVKWGPYKHLIHLNLSKLNISKSLLKDISLYEENGNQIEASLGSSSSSTTSLISQGIRVNNLPKKGRIVLELYDNPQEYEIPFSIKNISLTGQPLEQSQLQESKNEN